jgi:hypothetical protein
MYNFLYLIQDYNDLGTNIYKIGKTSQDYSSRLKGYPKGTRTFRIIEVDNCEKREIELIKIFNEKFTLYRGREYFTGNITEMINVFTDFCDKFIHLLELNKPKSININNTNNNSILIKTKESINDNICEKCNTKFDTKQHLIQHINKKNKCNIETPYQCQFCKKYFNYNSTMNRHINICELAKNKNITNEKNKNNNLLTTIIMSKIELDHKIILIKNIIKLDNHIIKDILDSDDNFETKIQLFSIALK